MTIQEQFMNQINQIHNEFLLLRNRSNHDDISDLPDREVIRYITRARALINRLSTSDSEYVKHCKEITNRGGFPGYVACRLAGVVESLKEDVAAGFLQSQRELIHGELFADFLEMAQHLLDEGYKDASAVIAGASLETHLHQLAGKFAIDVKIEHNGKHIHKKAERLNADLAGANAFSKLDSKNITAWLDLRNKAAHGHFDQYEKAQVGLMIASIREFISRNPA